MSSFAILSAKERARRSLFEIEVIHKSLLKRQADHRQTFGINNKSTRSTSQTAKYFFKRRSELNAAVMNLNSSSSQNRTKLNHKLGHLHNERKFARIDERVDNIAEEDKFARDAETGELLNLSPTRTKRPKKKKVHSSLSEHSLTRLHTNKPSPLGSKQVNSKKKKPKKRKENNLSPQLARKLEELKRNHLLHLKNLLEEEEAKEIQRQTAELSALTKLELQRLRRLFDREREESEERIRIKKKELEIELAQQLIKHNLLR